MTFANLALGSFGLNISWAKWMSGVQFLFLAGPAFYSIFLALWEDRRPISQQQPEAPSVSAEKRAA
jgi:hypothetical protein